MMKRGIAAAGVAAGILGYGTAALAADAEGKWVSGAVGIEVQSDHIVHSEDGVGGSDTYAKIEAAVDLHLTPELRLSFVGKLEPVLDLDPDQDRVFDDHGAWLDNLVLVYETERFGVYGGKFGATFGLHDAVVGLYGDTFTGDYEVNERIGFGGMANAALDGVGAVTVNASIFTRDDTFAADSILTGRGQLDRDDGGAGNTEGLNNYAVTLDFEPAFAEGLVLRAGVLRQDGGTGVGEDMLAYELGAVYEIEVTDDLILAPMVDYIHFDDNTDGVDGTVVDGAGQDVVTLGVAAGYGPWFGGVSGGFRSNDDATTTTDESFFQVSAGYAFEIGVTAELGWVSSDIEDNRSDVVGVMVGYGIEF